MALTPAERKAKLGLGGLTAIAKQLKLPMGHVSGVNSEKPGKESQRVRDAITARILELHPDTDPTTIWPDAPAATQRASA